MGGSCGSALSWHKSENQTDALKQTQTVSCSERADELRAPGAEEVRGAGRCEGIGDNKSCGAWFECVANAWQYPLDGRWAVPNTLMPCSTLGKEDMSRKALDGSTYLRFGCHQSKNFPSPPPLPSQYFPVPTCQSRRPRN